MVYWVRFSVHTFADQVPASRAVISANDVSCKLIALLLLFSVKV